MVFFLALLLLGVLDGKLPPDERHAATSSSSASLLILVRALWRTFLWYREWFVGTDRRLMLTLGILTRKVAMIPLIKVTDMRYDRPPIGQILGYGSFVLESAGQDQAFRVVHFVPHPDTLYRRISEELFTPSETRFLDRPAPGPKVLPGAGARPPPGGSAADPAGSAGVGSRSPGRPPPRTRPRRARSPPRASGRSRPWTPAATSGRRPPWGGRGRPART